MKTIVTHIGPDLDAITSIWMIKKFFHEWEESAVVFVPAGETLGGLPPDDNPDIWHVDTGFGTFDHHQTNDNICSATLIYECVKKHWKEDEALERLVTVVNDYDHFREVFFPDSTSDYWDLSAISAIDGWRLMYTDNPVKVVASGMDMLDGMYKTFQNKVWAEKEIKEKGIMFDTPWGKGLAVKTTNDEVVHLGQKMGYAVVIRKDPNKGYIRIKTLPKDSIDLSKAFEILKSQDLNATWFLHVSHHMILNGSSKNPNMKPTSLTLDQIIDILKHT
jgi:hypothetical protein